MPDVVYTSVLKKFTLEDALESEENIVAGSQHFIGLFSLYKAVRTHKEALERLVAFHVGVDVARVKVTEPETTWKFGAFNYALPMDVYDEAGGMPLRQVYLRCPQPAKCGEAYYPGAVREKLRTETAAYVWMQRHCPGVRIPHLYGFGFPEGGHFRFAGHMSIFRRAVLYVRQLVASWLGRPVPSNYLSVAAPDMPLNTGYMVIEGFGEAAFGKQLPLAVRNQPLLDQPVKMRNLFRGVSRIMLALARIPQPRIGSFRFNDDGTISLDGRPASSEITLLETDGAPQTIPIDRTYTNVDQYVSDLCTFYEEQFRTAPNAALSNGDCESQMSIMVLMRAVAHHFIDPERRNGPFFLFLSDGNAGNLMVDDEWNVTGLFDLEWMYAAPAGRINAPLWLTWASIDVVIRRGYDEYNTVRQAFMETFKEEEQLADTRALEAALGGSTLSSVMEASWSSHRFWFHLALCTTNSMPHIVQNRIGPLFADEDLLEPVLYKLWRQGVEDVKAQKLRDREEYKTKVKELFQDT